MLVILEMVEMMEIKKIHRSKLKIIDRLIVCLQFDAVV